jgi:DNA-cytosine methyltransferase
MSCEIDDFCNKVTKQHFPNCIQHGDIKTTGFIQYRGKIDILAGGFPCQPFSQAGKRRGTEDDRHLWPEMLRAIKEIQPRWIVGENVHGIINWSKGMVFEQVQSDLEAAGYKTWANVLPACSVNAFHTRNRTWFIAYSDCIRFYTNKIPKTINIENDIWNDSGQFELLVAEGKGYIPNTKANRIHNGIPNGLDEHRLKALGNAIVPQVAYQIFKAIEQFENI